MKKAIIASPVPLNIEMNSSVNRFQAVGGNPGNLVFMNAIEEQLNYEKKIDVDLRDLQDLNGSIMVMPSSNFIRHIDKNDLFFQKWVDLLKRTKCEITLVGLGAQSSAVFNTPKKLISALTREQNEFIRIVSERCCSIGVRGEYTAECLDLMGIHNYRVIGCPSVFKYLDGNYQHIKEAKPTKTQITVTPKLRARTKVIDFGWKNNSIWVKQSANEIPKIIKIMGKEIISPLYIKRNFPGLKMTSKELLDYSNRNSKIFFNIKEWNDFYAKEGVSFAYGTRFHGNMEALRNDVPALWITHDSRTKELVKFLHLPHITIEEFKNIENMEQLCKMCDYTDFYNNYFGMCANYVSFLNENGISHKYTLE